MTVEPSIAARFRIRLVALLLLVALAAGLAAAPGADAQRDDRRVTVMTQNLYLGASLDPAIAATSAEEFFTAVHEIYQGVVATNFNARAERIAALVERHRPDLVGLQEASLWRSGPLQMPPGETSPATRVEFDFLRILQRELRRRATSYRVVAVTENADIEVPSPLTGKDIRLTDRDVILARSGLGRRGIRFSNVQRANFSPPAQLRVNTVVGPIEFTRGWNSVDVRMRGGRKFRFVNTHLEVQAGAPFQVAQAQELLAGPAATEQPVMMVGDFNTNADRRNPDTPTYGLLLDAGFRDAWGRRRGGFTCCQASDLLNGRSQLSTRIDLVLLRPASAFRVQRRAVVGRLLRDKTDTEPRLWPSDHAGVVVTVRR